MALLPRAAALGLFAVSLCIGLAGTALAGELALKRVLLSSGGVGYFEHEAQVTDSEKLALDVPLDQVDDVLKSIVVFDDKGGVGTVRLPGREPLGALFRDLPIQADALNSAPELMAALKGSAVTVSGKRALSGRLIAVETETVALPDGAGTTTRHRVSLMTADGVQQFLLEEQDAVQFADPALQGAVNAALEGFATHRVRDRRTLEIEARGTGERTVRVGYVVGAPLWKASYRMTLGEGNAGLQGWAHLENLSGRPWDRVELTLVAGNPVTFRQALYTAYFVDRPEVPVEVLGRVLPPLDEGALASGEPAPPAAKMMGRANLAELALDSASSSQAMAGAAPPPAPAEVAEGAIATAREEAATQVILHIAEPITLAAGQSLSVPVIDASVPGEGVVLYSPTVHARHPLAAVRLTNTTGTGLPPGVLTLYERRASGTSYVGDARLSTLPSNDKRLLSFAVDQAIAVDREDRDVRGIVSAKISQGMLRLSVRESARSHYRIKSAASEPRRLIIEHPRRPGWELAGGHSDVEISENDYRIPVALEPSAALETDVVLERTIGETHALADFTPDMLVFYADSEGVPPAVKQAFRQLSAKRAEIETLRQRIARFDEEKSRLFEDQSRLRENLNQVPAESDLHARYLKKLAAQEDAIDKLTVGLATTRDALASAESSYAEMIRTLEI